MILKVIGRATYRANGNYNHIQEKRDGYPNAILVYSSVTKALKACEANNKRKYK